EGRKPHALRSPSRPHPSSQNSIRPHKASTPRMAISVQAALGWLWASGGDIDDNPARRRQSRNGGVRDYHAFPHPLVAALRGRHVKRLPTSQAAVARTLFTIVSSPRRATFTRRG